MAKVELTRDIAAPVSEVWKAWDDYGSIWRYNPNLSGSHLINGSKSTGLGAERQCDFVDGKNYIQERIVDYVPERRITVDIYNGTVPLKRAKAVIEMEPIALNRTRLKFTMEFQPSMGLLGYLMTPLIRRQFRTALGKLVDANKAYVERGETVSHAA